MFIFLLVVAFVLVFLGGFFLGRRYLIPPLPHGAFKIFEQGDGRLTYMLELWVDPELLVFEEEVRFAVISPDYEELLSR